MKVQLFTIPAMDDEEKKILDLEKGIFLGLFTSVVFV